MKRNCEFIDLGEFEMTSPVMRVSDPCYERDVWCCGTVDHCKLGTWEAGVLKTDEGEWGTRCAVLAARHKDTGPDFNAIHSGNVRKMTSKCVEQPFEVGVDSGQAGFFDDAFYQNDTIFEEQPASNFATGDFWYRHVCDITLGKMLAGVLPYGVVSSSGFGDGGYACATRMLTRAARSASHASCLLKNNRFLQGSASALPCVVKEVQSL